MEEFIYERKVCYYETDQMGIVHHSNYIRWMEEARLALMEHLGLSYAEMERQGVLIPVLSASCEYKRAFRYGDTFRVQMKPAYYNGIKMKIVYEIFGTDDLLHAKGESGHGFVDTAFHPLSLKKSRPDFYEILNKWHLAHQENTL